MTGQTKKHSFIESIINILIGYILAVFSNIVIFYFYGVELSLKTNMEIGAWFTIISFIRSYFIRRWFNKIMLKVWERTDGK